MFLPGLKAEVQSYSSILQFYRHIMCFDLEFRGKSAETGESM